MSDIPSFPYELLWHERTIRSVANLTRDDGHEFLALAPQVPVRTEVTTYPLEAADAGARRPPRRPLLRRGGRRALRAIRPPSEYASDVERGEHRTRPVPLGVEGHAVTGSAAAILRAHARISSQSRRSRNSSGIARGRRTPTEHDVLAGAEPLDLADRRPGSSQAGLSLAGSPTGPELKTHSGRCASSSAKRCRKRRASRRQRRM